MSEQCHSAACADLLHEGADVRGAVWNDKLNAVLLSLLFALLARLIIILQVQQFSVFS